MDETATGAALAALRYWADQACPGAAGRDKQAETEALRQAAWLVQGVKPSGSAWPQCDINQPLQSIFNRIESKSAQAPDVYVRRATLAIQSDVLFPTERGAIHQHSRDPIQGLQAALAELAQRHLPAQLQLEGLLYALQRYAWCLPSPLKAVSLYDFARTHAAVAAAQTMYDGDFFLLGGDLSGVQSFLYTLPAAGATKQLRGRSFYLQLLTEVSARYLLRAAGLPLSNLLYAGGGRFYALLPGQIGGQPMHTWLLGQRTLLDAFLLQQHQGDLFLALGGGLLRSADLLDSERFAQAWGTATEAINAAKRRRFAEQGAALFAPIGHGGSREDQCVICGYQGYASDFAKPNQDRPGLRCRLCDSFEDLGRLLHNAEYLLFHNLALQPLQASNRRLRWFEVLDAFGVHVQLQGDHAQFGDRGNNAPRGHVYSTTVLALKDRVEPLTLSTPYVLGFRPMANTTPTIQPQDLNNWRPDDDDERLPRIGDVKPFSMLVAQSQGVKRLGVLRMDVDNLGDLFRYRLDSGLARVSALSAALALFFEGWVGHIGDELNQTSQHGSVYTIYSGGDDLFIVGSWHLLPGLARTINDDLSRYAGGNKEVHVSAGMSLHSAKFPLYQAAEAAEDELKHAKQLPCKTAFGWLEQVVKWKHAPQLFQLVDEMRAYLEPHGASAPEKSSPISRALLQTLQQLYVQYNQDRLNKRRQGQPEKFFYGPWMWRGVYQLSRVAQQLPKDEQTTRDWVFRLRDSLLDGIDRPANTGGRAIERMGLAARWVQLLIRKEQD